MELSGVRQQVPRQEDHQEFKASLGYIADLRLAWATCNSILEWSGGKEESRERLEASVVFWGLNLHTRQVLYSKLYLKLKNEPHPIIN